MTKVAVNAGEEAVHIVIIGAGLAGIATAIALKKQLHFDDFTIYERQASVGGVWQENTYPGCGSDVPGHWYSLSNELNPRWSALYVSQPEIRDYYLDIWTRHGLAAHTVFGAEVVSAEWDSAAQQYDVEIEHGATRARERRTARVVVWAAGGFHAPVFPEDVPGVAQFKGPVWHSARWRHDVELKGKRVGVVGNGCSAAQFVPRISEDPSVEVVNFVRSPQWYIPRTQYKYPEWAKWMFAHVPLVMWAYRAYIMARNDKNYLIFRNADSAITKLARTEMTKYIKMNAPKELHEQLIPDYPPGCKRLIVDPSYLASLHRPNVSLNWTPIDHVVEEGLRLRTGETVPLDAIIFGTGFHLASSFAPPRLQIKGTEGTLTEYWEKHGGGRAYLGLAVPTFPNLFMMLGPNSAGGHASVVFVEETQLGHFLQLIRPIVQRKALSFAPREEATVKYNAWLQSRLARSVWNYCSSYYRASGGQGRNFAIFPGPVTLFWLIARNPEWGDYDVVGGERWARERRAKRAARLIVLSVLGLLLGLAVILFTAGVKGHVHNILP
ncbi:FAD/NAD(P)-binding domain-containing protein [Auriscalpium vulgare]|uniref:FAD/NAD(P)-binding domain-containing protein n=1 Tax=Auriscalpium vulgare TaxID=40419 RepID=A0ACB8R2Q1_9AGAM|nr:FAD/NAD(P)-binding domain-containing protein [Auriscalpium vulgare]